MIDAESVCFTSDTHWGHRGILGYANRPFDTIEAHDEALIANWNAAVPASAHVFHLGDFLFRGDAEAIVGRLSGQIHLVYGNHDSKLRQGKYRTLFASVGDYKEIDVRLTPSGLTQKICLMHFPIESWNKRHHGSWHLHGHCHGSLSSPDWQRRLDVGVDVWGLRPIRFETVAAHMATKRFGVIDHHGRPR